MNTKTTCAALAAALLSACTGGAKGNGSTASAAAKLTPLGKTAAGGGVSFTVTDVAERAQLGIPAAGMKAEPGETYVVVRYPLKNEGAKPLEYLGRPSLTLLDEKGSSLAPDNGASTLATSGCRRSPAWPPTATSS